MKHLAWAVALTILVAVVANGTWGEDAAKAPEPPKHEQVEKIKSLAGDWSGTFGEGKEAGQANLSYKVTAGGSAVVETIFTGTDHEMVTVYTVDHGTLVLTHYCVMGNQPHMKAAEQKDANTIEFTCDGKPGNLDADNEAHMHTGKITWVDADHIQAEWTALKDGQPTFQAKLDVTRKK